MQRHKPSSRKLFLFLAIFGAAIAVYANSLSGDFISDDNPIVVNNPLVRKPISIPAILGSSYWPRNGQPGNASGGLYRPFTILTYALNRHLLGEGSIGFHIINVILHGIASLLLFCVMEALGFPMEAAAIGALSFAVLPIHTEAVSWIVGRGEILSAALVLAAWLLMHENDNWPRITAGLICYGLALLSKESAAPFPVALILGEVFSRRGTLKSLVERRLLVWVCALGVLGLYLAWRNSILGAVFSVGSPYFTHQSPMVVMLTMANFLLRGWLWPMSTGVGLCADYFRPSFPDAAVTDISAWIALAVIALTFVWAARDYWKEKSAWAFSVLVFFCFAAPLSNLLVSMEIIGAERIMYLPSVGFCLLIASAWGSMRKHRLIPQPWLKALTAACLLIWSILTIARNRVWRNADDFYASAAACAPANPRALSGLGVVADKAGRHLYARELYQKALDFNPGYSEAAYNMGKSYYDAGDWREAKKWFSDFEDASRADKDVLCYLGSISEHEGHNLQALHYYERALQLEPSALEPRFDAGLLLYRMGHTQEAAEQLQEYLRNAPPPQDARDAKALLDKIQPRQ